MKVKDFSILVKWLQEKKRPFQIVLYSGRTIENVGSVNFGGEDGAMAFSDVKPTGRKEYIRRKPTDKVIMKGKPTAFSIADVEIIFPNKEVEFPAEE